MREPSEQQRHVQGCSGTSSSRTAAGSAAWGGAPAPKSGSEGLEWGSLDKSEVEKYIDLVLRDSRAVKTIATAMSQAGCQVDRDYFKVFRCDTKTGGGFSLEHGVVLCHNQLQSYADVENTMAHELIHAYDYCRIPGMDFKDCEQHACSEVRAANLSGDCSLTQEFLRGNVSLTKPSAWGSFFERCVERRAALSVALNPRCGGPKGACAEVKKVMQRCMADKAPFEVSQDQQHS